MVIGFMRPIRETSFLEWENAELLAAHLEREASNFVAVQAGGIVGAIIAGSVGVRGAISHVAVVESHRRQGVAGALVDKVLADFRTRGIRRVFLFAETGNDPARRLWAYCGFSETHNEVTWECDL
jgi:ribosomal-protein-alanine N-acetyltransferase